MYCIQIGFMNSTNPNSPSHYSRMVFVNELSDVTGEIERVKKERRLDEVTSINVYQEIDKVLYNALGIKK